MPSFFSQQKENWRYAARLSALCALWQGYWRLQYGLCLQQYEVCSRYPEVLYSVSSISNLSNFNKLSNLSISDKNDQQWPDVVWGFHAHQSCFCPQEEVAGQVKHKSLRDIRRDIELSYQEELQAPCNHPVRLHCHAGFFPNRKQCTLVDDHLLIESRVCVSNISSPLLDSSYWCEMLWKQNGKPK